MDTAEQASAQSGRTSNAAQLFTTVVLAAIAAITVWATAGSGPEICGFEFAGDWNCFASNRQQIGWVATVAIGVSVAGHALASVFLHSPRARKLVWASSVVAIVSSTVAALSALN